MELIALVNYRPFHSWISPTVNEWSSDAQHSIGYQIITEISALCNRQLKCMTVYDTIQSLYLRNCLPTTRPKTSLWY